MARPYVRRGTFCCGGVVKPRARVNPISKKRAAAHPELLRGNSTIVRSSSPGPRTPKKLTASGSTPTRKSPPKKRNAKRAKANHDRSYGKKRDFIVAQPCAVCGYSANLSDPAHVSGDGGAGYKSSSKYLVPLCVPHDEPAPGYAEGFAFLSLIGCHRESHAGVQSFEAKHGVSLVALAAEYEARWVLHRANWSGR